MIPTSEHNESLVGDTLYQVSLNYEWRKLVTDIVDRGLHQFAADIEDETDRATFENRIAALIEDFYDEDIVDGIPLGMIIAWVGELASIPAKYLLCNGALRASSEYPELVAILPPELIEGANFRTPSLSSKFLRGGNTDGNIGLTGGAISHTITTAQLPAHHHIVPAHAHTVGTRAASGSNTGSVSLGSLAANGTIATDTEPATDTSDTGSGDDIPILPPYQYFYYIIKALP